MTFWGGVGVAVVLVVAVFLLLRAFWLWYWRIGEIADTLGALLEEVQALHAQIDALRLRSTPAAAPGPAAVER